MFYLPFLGACLTYPKFVFDKNNGLLTSHEFPGVETGMTHTGSSGLGINVPTNAQYSDSAVSLPVFVTFDNICLQCIIIVCLMHFTSF